MLSLLLSDKGIFIIITLFIISSFMYVNNLLHIEHEKVNKLKNTIIQEQVKTNNLKTKLIKANNIAINKVFEAKQIQKKKDLQDATKQYDDKDINCSSGLHWLTI